MISANVQKKITLTLSVLWLIGFAIGIWLFNSQLNQLATTASQIESTANQLQNFSWETRNIINETHSQKNELITFQSVLSYLPETDAHARSQNAVMTEVQNLRSKISQRMKGRMHIVVDTKANILYLKQGMKLVISTDCSAGKGGVFYDKRSGRRWEFVTPQGRYRVLNKYQNPVWIKPDWAFSEEGKIPPPPDDPSRRVEGELGAYLLNLGNGYLIHGTKHEDRLGRPASHGCVRLGSNALKEIYEKTPTGTEVYIY